MAVIESQRRTESQKEQAEAQRIDIAKKALSDQYAYDTSQQYDKDGNIVDPSSNNASSKISSRQSADGCEDLSNRAVAQ